jgi:ubiquinone/menaquinone biosynthesis C-methylase UbiE
MGYYANRIFPWVLDVTEPKEMPEQRRLLLREVRGEILEIGIGTGANLPYYPDNIKMIVAVDPTDTMRHRAELRAHACGRTVEWHHGRGEQLPFNKGVFDTVVIADVLCTVDNVDAVLRDAYRVLKPGGRFHFLEHGIAREEKIRKWQFRLNGLSKAIACGCELTRDIEQQIRSSSFLIEEIVNVTPFSGMNVLYTHIRGIAKKPA